MATQFLVSHIGDIDENPLLQDFDFPPFNPIKAEHVRPGIRALLKRLEGVLDEFEMSVEPTRPELVKPLGKTVDRLNVVWGMVNHLKLVKYSLDLQSASEEVQPKKVKLEHRVGQSKPFHNAIQHLLSPLDQQQSEI